MKLIKPNIIFRNSLRPLPQQNVKYIVIHHAEASKATWQDIHRWHQERGWAGAGYHEYITKTGEVYLLRGSETAEQCKEGVHVKGHNRESYGICLEGNYNGEQRIPYAQMEALFLRIAEKKKIYPKAKIRLHKQLSSTDCPGKFFPLVLDERK